MLSRDELIEETQRHFLRRHDGTESHCTCGASVPRAERLGPDGLDIHRIDALLARWPHIAGPERVETVEEAETLPLGTVVRDRHDIVFERFNGRWGATGNPDDHSECDFALPITILHRPDATNPEEGTR